MMSPGILEELRVVGVAVVCGAVITVVYDLLRIFRRVITHGNLWIGIEDFFFWIWTALWSFSVLYRENDGNLRFYTIAAMVFGMIVYHQMVSELLVEVCAKLLNSIVKAFVVPLKKVKIYITNLGKKLKNVLGRLIMKIEHYDR